MWKSVILLIVLCISIKSNAFAQNKNNSKVVQIPQFVIKISETKVPIKGNLFNSIEYDFGTSKSKTDSYYYTDSKNVYICDIEFNYEKNGAIVSKVICYKCPKVKINKNR